MLEYEDCTGYHFQSKPTTPDGLDPSTSSFIQFGSFKGKELTTDDQAAKIPIAPQSPSSKQKENPANWSELPHPDGMDGLSEVVNDIAFRFWDCSRCMSMGHHISACQNKIRCRACYRLGHKERSCTGKEKSSFGKIWRPKKRVITVPVGQTGANPSLDASSSKAPICLSRSREPPSLTKSSNQNLAKSKSAADP